MDARKPGSRCAQRATATEAASTPEDCLFLNVTTPSALRAGQKLPVMVWWADDIAPIDFGAEHHCDFWAPLNS